MAQVGGAKDLPGFGGLDQPVLAQTDMQRCAKRLVDDAKCVWLVNVVL